MNIRCDHCHQEAIVFYMVGPPIRSTYMARCLNHSDFGFDGDLQITRDEYLISEIMES